MCVCESLPIIVFKFTMLDSAVQRRLELWTETVKFSLSRQSAMCVFFLEIWMSSLFHERASFRKWKTGSVEPLWHLDNLGVLGKLPAYHDRLALSCDEIAMVGAGPTMARERLKVMDKKENCFIKNISFMKFFSWGVSLNNFPDYCLWSIAWCLAIFVLF